MIVRLDFDFELDFAFLISGSLPIELKDEIGQRKDEIYQALRPDPVYWYILVHEQDFLVKGRRFRVCFCVDRTRTDPTSEIQPMRVRSIKER